MVHKPQAIVDVECYINYFLIMFMRLSDGHMIQLERLNDEPLDVTTTASIIQKYELFDFNGIKYDVPMIRLAMTGVGCAELKRASDAIVSNQLSPHNFERHYKLPPMNVDHVDLSGVAPGQGQITLKMFMARLHARRLQDLPYDPDAVLTAEQMAQIPPYCANDLDGTRLLLRELTPQVELRRTLSRQYRLDLRSRSDAQIAEEVLKSEVARQAGHRISRPRITPGEFLYKAPPFINFSTEQLRSALELVTTRPFVVTPAGQVEMPPELAALSLRIGSTPYNIAMGGLHSQEQGMRQVADPGQLLADWDVTSYYPTIILNCGLNPPHLGDAFQRAYRTIVEERIRAKASGDRVKDQCLKIVINGSFGKLGSPYSVLYAPNLMVQVTVTGQLSLLMLIEGLEGAGISVVSANTDGIVTRCPRELETTMIRIIGDWEIQTGFRMERSDYAALYSRDINNYIAIKLDGGVKRKGCFGVPGLGKNPQHEICMDAVVEYLRDGTPPIDTIRGCEDIRKFVTMRKVTGGAVKNHEYLGKTVRWYYAKGETGTINYAENAKIVADTRGARPLMELPDMFPHDIDYAWYLARAESTLKDLGIRATDGAQIGLF